MRMRIDWKDRVLLAVESMAFVAGMVAAIKETEKIGIIVLVLAAGIFLSCALLSLCDMIYERLSTDAHTAPGRAGKEEL